MCNLESFTDGGIPGSREKYWSVLICGGWPEKAITFLDNHDTIRTPYCDFPTDAKCLIQGHVFLLTHPGIPGVFHAHFYQRGSKVHDAVMSLGKLSTNLGIGRKSHVDVILAMGSRYAALIDGKAVVIIGYESWNPTQWTGSKMGPATIRRGLDRLDQVIALVRVAIR